jgi:hypothetical protein
MRPSQRIGGSGLDTQKRNVFILLFALLISYEFVPLALAPESTFSVIWITDTQYLSQTYPSDFDNTCNWIISNKDTYNIKMVVHTGDIVNTPSDLNQWENANHSMGILLDNGIPYCWDAGNHDDQSSWNGMNFKAFNASAMSQRPYWLGDDSNGRSTAVHFEFGNWNFIVVNLEYEASDPALSWANSILDSHPNSYAIVATHAYLDENCRYHQWSLHLQNTVLNNHPNVFMTLNGHYYSNGNANRTVIGNRYELFFNYQNLDSERGAATVRILTFNVLESKVDVKTYKIYSGQFATDSENQFTLNIPIGAIPEFPANLLPLVVALIALSSVVLRPRRPIYIQDSQRPPRSQ